MNLSQYLIYLPYRTAWSFIHLFRKSKILQFYCGGQVDYVVMESIIKYFPDAEIVAKNKKVKKELNSFGIKCKLYPTFPDVLVMPRHTARKYPEPRMKKIGLRHGAYHFKDFVSAARYHAFDVYLVTSQKEVELALEKGITNTIGVGFPKIDPAFNNTISEEIYNQIKRRINLDDEKPVIIFTATWNKSGMSAIDIWINNLKELTKDYNVMVTVHHWTEDSYKQIIKQTEGVFFIEDKDILPYLVLADVMIADMSSIIAEFCALDKPIITFRVPDKKRTSQEIKDMLDNMSIRVDTFDQLQIALKESVKNPDQLSAQRKKYNKIMFDDLDGKAGERAANIIKKYL
ncbi:MAG: hypothetical protein HND50_03950 [Calditrichaeota bacterium]|nr:hypothetical protein [Calditrichota bacterium]